MKIENVLVLGASGTIGSLTGGVLAQNGFHVDYLSRTKSGSQKGLEKAMAQARSEVIAKNITCGDYDTMLLDSCSRADWILECVAEDLAIKQAMYQQIDHYRKPGSIVSSVTSSLVLEDLPKGRSEDFQKHFLYALYNRPGRCSPAKSAASQRPTRLLWILWLTSSAPGSAGRLSCQT